jgi:hypothetical protein
MKKAVVLLVFLLGTTFVSAQTESVSTVDVKLGLGTSFLGSGDILVGKVEGELTKKWNRLISNSVSLNFGYGKSTMFDQYVLQETFTTHLDGNLFLSPFGNHHFYNFKLGTGFSLMYVSDTYPARDAWARQSQSDRRVSLGASMIVEQEITIAKRNLLGVKAMIQPYLNGDIASSLMLKVGRKL